MKTRLYKIHKFVLKKYGQKHLDYYKNMKENDRGSYSVYVNKNLDNYVSPQEWFDNIKKKDHKLAEYVEKHMGSKCLLEYNALEIDDKTNYYLYLKQREKYGVLNELNLTPREWFNNKIEREMNTDFSVIAQRLNVSVESVREWYKEGIRKIKKIIKDNPKYKEWNEFL